MKEPNQALNNTPRGMRLHIGIFGKRNAGKSSLMNILTGQELAIVSDIPGTTTDPNQKAMEIFPIGPVLLIDTPGMDDIGALGEERVKKAAQIIDKTDIAVVICDYKGIDDFEIKLYNEFHKRNIPVVTIINKTDAGEIPEEELLKIKSYCGTIIQTSLLKGVEGFDINLFRDKLIEILPEEAITPPKIVSDLVKEGDTVILVIPVDEETPKGRLILPQVQVLRDLIDGNIAALAVKDSAFNLALKNLKNPPALVICDSQVFDKVNEVLSGTNIPLTSFSVVFARLKGDLKSFIEGAATLDKIKSGDKILICESCSHHKIEDDIAQTKIPAWIRRYTGCEPVFNYCYGHDFPENLSEYRLIIHCGACMTNRREVLSRISHAKAQNVPITNYGIAIAKCFGILERAVAPFGIIV